MLYSDKKNPSYIELHERKRFKFTLAEKNPPVWPPKSKADFVNKENDQRWIDAFHLHCPESYVTFPQGVFVIAKIADFNVAGRVVNNGGKLKIAFLHDGGIRILERWTSIDFIGKPSQKMFKNYHTNENGLLGDDVIGKVRHSWKTYITDHLISATETYIGNSQKLYQIIAMKDDFEDCSQISENTPYFIFNVPEISLLGASPVTYVGVKPLIKGKKRIPWISAVDLYEQDEGNQMDFVFDIISKRKEINDKTDFDKWNEFLQKTSIESPVGNPTDFFSKGQAVKITFGNYKIDGIVGDRCVLVSLGPLKAVRSWSNIEPL